MSEQGRRNPVQALLRGSQVPLSGIIVILFIGLSVSTSTFLSAPNLSSVALGAAIDLILIVGQTIVIIGGGFDLSVGSTMGLSAVTVGLLIGNGVPWWVAVLAALGVGLACGLVNGLLVAYVGVNPLIATLGTLFVFQGLSLVVTASETVYASGTPLVDSIGQATWFGLPAPVWFAVVTVAVGTVVMRRGRFGRNVFLMGGNRDAAYLVGVRVQRVELYTYLVSGLVAGLAGVLAIARVGTADAATGANEALPVIAAVVLGGASLAGGKGSIIGAALGVLLIGLVRNAVVLLNVPVFWQQLLVGLVLIIAVASNVFSEKLRHRVLVRRQLGRVGVPSAPPPVSDHPGAL